MDEQFVSIPVNITVTSETVTPDDGKPQYRLYHVPGFAPMRWNEFLALLDEMNEDMREINEMRRRPADIQ